ncbi:M48 family metalloprotease, partial [Nonomuraea sp. RK-328]|nr:M48 family metalloprotease [Nonomuraea sp. RK-328]
MSALNPSSELVGLAQLTAVLRNSARLPGLLVYVAGELGDNAAAEARPCGSGPVVGVGAELLDDDHSPALVGSVAHEIAHHALGHLTGWLVPTLDWLYIWTCVAGIMSAFLPVPGWLAPALLSLALAARLCAAWRRRAAEFAADRHAVALLDSLDMPGPQIVTAMLIRDLAVEPLWYAMVGWLAGTHPPAHARLRRLADAPSFTLHGLEATS